MTKSSAKSSAKSSVKSSAKPDYRAKRPVKILSMLVEDWARLDVMASREGKTRSGLVAQMVNARWRGLENRVEPKRTDPGLSPGPSTQRPKRSRKRRRS